MKIAQINLGTIEIPPKSWGAIEKVIWNYKIELERLGNQVDIIFPWELYDNSGKLKYDIVHFHVHNQAIDTWRDSNLPYVFSIHDHHVVRYGKNSPLYTKNLFAMKQSVASITYAEFLLDFFDRTDKLYYIPHGVDNKIYRDKGTRNPGKRKLLCVANNGYADDNKSDRKGFRYAIEAAMELNMDITVVGPENNMNFFNSNSDLLQYEKLKLIKDPNEEELVDIYNEHSIFLHLSELEAGQPNLTLLEALACGLPIVGTYIGKEPLNGMVKSSRNSKEVKIKIEEVLKDWENYHQMALETAKKYDWSNIVKQLNDFYNFTISVNKNYTNDDVRKKVLSAYEKTNYNLKESAEPKVSYNINFNDGAYFEVLSKIDKSFNVNFIDDDTNDVKYSLKMNSNTWAKTNTKYFKNWRIEAKDDDDNFVYNMKLENENVLIDFHSSSIGDTLAWVPYAEEFRKKHNCIVYCSIHKNLHKLFEKEYKDIIFIKPGTVIDNLYATYKLGWFSPNPDIHPNDYRTMPLQKTASDILGLPYEEIRPKITIPKQGRPIGRKYVVIAQFSTADAKHWHYPGGWQRIVDWLKENGLEVMVISSQDTNLRGVIKEIGDQPLEKRINQINHSEFMITIGSGLAWIAWAIGKKVVMISGFSKPFCEFQENCIRVINENVCNGCFNDLKYEFDRGDWNWCPVNKGTPKMFECSKSITPEMVIKEMVDNGLIK